MPLRRSYRPNIPQDTTSLGDNPALNLLLRRLQRDENQPNALSNVLDALTGVGERFIKAKTAQRQAQEYGAEKKGMADLSLLQTVMPSERSYETEAEETRRAMDKLNLTQTLKTAWDEELVDNPYSEFGVGPELVKRRDLNSWKEVYREQGREKRTKKRGGGGGWQITQGTDRHPGPKITILAGDKTGQTFPTPPTGLTPLVGIDGKRMTDQGGNPLWATAEGDTVRSATKEEKITTGIGGEKLMAQNVRDAFDFLNFKVGAIGIDLDTQEAKDNKVFEKYQQLETAYGLQNADREVKNQLLGIIRSKLKVKKSKNPNPNLTGIQQ